MTAGATSGRAAPRLAIVLAVVFGLAVVFVTGQERSRSGWPVATPESQGFDSGVLVDLLEYVHAKGLPLHHLLVIRRGQLILDASLYPYSPEGPHDLASVTKSITSLLVGIAIDKGLIESVRQPVVSLLPAAVRGTPDAQRQAMTVEHLLTMTSGLDCGFEPGERELWAMRRSDDWPVTARSGAPERLTAALAEVKQPPALEPPAALPPLAGAMSGTRYEADDNAIGLRTLSMQFSSDRAEATLEFLGREWHVPVSLNGRPIVATPAPGRSPTAATGRWVSEREFVLDLDTIAEVNHFIFRLTFDGDELRIIVDEVTGELKGLPIRARRTPSVR